MSLTVGEYVGSTSIRRGDREFPIRGRSSARITPPSVNEYKARTVAIDRLRKSVAAARVHPKTDQYPAMAARWRAAMLKGAAPQERDRRVIGEIASPFISPPPKKPSLHAILISPVSLPSPTAAPGAESMEPTPLKLPPPAAARALHTTLPQRPKSPGFVATYTGPNLRFGQRSYPLTPEQLEALYIPLGMDPKK